MGSSDSLSVPPVDGFVSPVGCRGFGFVYYPTVEDAQRAVDNLDG